MPVFNYKALNTTGNVIQGYVVANNYDKAFSELLKKDLNVITLNKKTKNVFFKNQSWVTEWAKDMGFFLNKGLSLIESLEISKTRLVKNKRQLIDEIIAEIHSGNRLSIAFKNTNEIPTLLISFINLAENNGRYKEAFLDFAAINQEKNDFSKSFLQSMQYPLILSIVMLLMLVGFCEFLLPSFLDFFEQNNLNISESTKIFISFANTVKNIVQFITNPIVLFFLAILFLVNFFVKPFKKITSKIMIELPFFGSIHKELLQSLYLNTFSKLIKNGHYIDKAAEYSASIISNFYMQKQAQKILTTIKETGQIALSISKHLNLSNDYLALLSTGEKTASLAFYAQICAESIKRKTQKNINNILAWTGPILVTTIGLITVFMVVAIVLPIYEQITKIN